MSKPTVRDAVHELVMIQKRIRDAGLRFVAEPGSKFDHALETLLPACPLDDLRAKGVKLLNAATDEEAEGLVAIMQVWAGWPDSKFGVYQLDQGMWRASCLCSSAKGDNPFRAVVNLRDKMLPDQAGGEGE